MLIGVSGFDDARLASVDAACRSVDVLSGLLSDPMLGLWRPGQVTVIRDPGSASELVERIAVLAAGASGTFLVCYVGCAVVSASGQVYLAVGCTRADRLESTAVAWSSLAGVLGSCPALVRRVILDCAVSGALPAGGGLADLTRMDGVDMLIAAGRSVGGARSVARDGGCTDFVGELVDLIGVGIPTKPAWLGLTDVYPSLCERLLARDVGLPEYGSAEGSSFIANAAVGKVQRATILLRDATRVAHSINPPAQRVNALADIAEGVACVDPEQAARLAYAIAGDSLKPETLTRVARALAITAPHHATQLLDDAQRLAGSIRDHRTRTLILSTIVWGLARTDLDRAQRLAGSITDDHDRAMASTGIVKSLVLTDPDRAEQLAYAITEPYWRSCALLNVSERLATTNADKAERVLHDAEHVIRSMTDLGVRAMTLADVARLWATSFPQRAGRVLDDAVRLAYSITDVPSRVLSLTNVVQEMADMDPGRADTLIDDAENLARSITDPQSMATALAFVVRALATTAPSQAEHLAYSITEKHSRVSALVTVAQRWTQNR